MPSTLPATQIPALRDHLSSILQALGALPTDSLGPTARAALNRALVLTECALAATARLESIVTAKLADTAGDPG